MNCAPTTSAEPPLPGTDTISKHPLTGENPAARPPPQARTAAEVVRARARADRGGAPGDVVRALEQQVVPGLQEDPGAELRLGPRAGRRLGNQDRGLLIGT